MAVWEFLKEAAARNVLFVAALVVMTGLAFYALRKFRDSIDDDQQTPMEFLANYREMHEQGDISDQEYRTIKSRLRAQLQKDQGDRPSDS